MIEHGSYSDYRVVGVYSSKANAAAIAAKINAEEHYDAATIAKWTLNPSLAELNAGRSPFHVTMEPDGTLVGAVRPADWQYAIGEGLAIWERTKAPAYKGKGIPDAVHGTVWATDEQHAVKIANEWRLQAIATGKLRPLPTEAKS